MTAWTHEPWPRGPLPDGPNVVGGYRVTSWFGTRPDPFTGQTSGHSAMDVALPEGTPLYTVADGKLSRGWDPGGGGNWGGLIISGSERVGYGHCQRFDWSVPDGVWVPAGTLLGWSGNTGRSTGAHIHLAYDNDDPDMQWDDPYDQLTRIYATTPPPPAQPEEIDMPINDADAALIASKVGELLSGRAAVQGHPWAFADGEAKTVPYTTLPEVVSAVNWGTVGQTIKLLDAIRQIQAGEPVDLDALADDLAKDLADELAKRLVA